MFDKYPVTNCKKLIESIIIKESQENTNLARHLVGKLVEKQKIEKTDLKWKLLYFCNFFTFSKIWF